MKYAAEWKGKPLWVPFMERAAIEPEYNVFNIKESIWEIIYQSTTNGKSLDKNLPFHSYLSHTVSKHKRVGKQASSTLALTGQLSLLIFHCNCFLLIWMLKCIIGHDPGGPGTNGSGGREEDLPPQCGRNMLCLPINNKKCIFLLFAE